GKGGSGWDHPGRHGNSTTPTTESRSIGIPTEAGSEKGGQIGPRLGSGTCRILVGSGTSHILHSGTSPIHGSGTSCSNHHIGTNTNNHTSSTNTSNHTSIARGSPQKTDCTQKTDFTFGR